MKVIQLTKGWASHQLSDDKLSYLVLGKYYAVTLFSFIFGSGLKSLRVAIEVNSCQLQPMHCT